VIANFARRSRPASKRRHRTEPLNVGLINAGYGRIQDIRSGATALYSNAAIPAGLDGTWDFVRTESVGGTGFSAISLLGFSECVRDAVRADGDDDDGDPA
jgi:hypothetical protein